MKPQRTCSCFVVWEIKRWQNVVDCWVALASSSLFLIFLYLVPWQCIRLLDSPHDSLTSYMYFLRLLCSTNTHHNEFSHSISSVSRGLYHYGSDIYKQSPFIWRFTDWISLWLTWSKGNCSRESVHVISVIIDRNSITSTNFIYSHKELPRPHKSEKASNLSVMLNDGVRFYLIFRYIHIRAEEKHHLFDLFTFLFKNLALISNMKPFRRFRYKILQTWKRQGVCVRDTRNLFDFLCEKYCIYKILDYKIISILTSQSLHK